MLNTCLQSGVAEEPRDAACAVPRRQTWVQRRAVVVTYAWSHARIVDRCMFARSLADARQVAVARPCWLGTRQGTDSNEGNSMGQRVTSTGAYALGHGEREQRRLIAQSELLRSSTTQFLDEAGLAPGMRVLDVGCGTVDVTFLAAELVGRREPSAASTGRRTSWPLLSDAPRNLACGRWTFWPQTSPRPIWAARSTR